jgi:hypothetical protein
MKSGLVKSKHIDLAEPLSVMSDPRVSAKDAMMIWRKGLRRADNCTKELLNLAKFHSKKLITERVHSHQEIEKS